LNHCGSDHRTGSLHLGSVIASCIFFLLSGAVSILVDSNFGFIQGTRVLNYFVKYNYLL
jgi:hypothetical protein